MNVDLQLRINLLCSIIYLSLHPFAKCSCLNGQLSIEGCPIIQQFRNVKQFAVQFLDRNDSFLSGNGIDASGDTTAGTLQQNPGIVSRAIADQGHGIGTDGGDDQLAIFPIGQHIAVFIDDLRDGDKEFQNRAMAILLENENWKRLQEYVRKQKKEEAACGERTNEQYA